MESNSRPKYIQVESTLEFSRLVCALERMPRVSFLHEHKGSKVLSVQIDLLKEKPVIYYTPNSDVGHYLCYGFKSGKEYASIVENTNDTSKLYSPIIKIKDLPDILKDGSDEGTKYHPVRLEDMASLAKLSYGLDEVPFPLFTFPHGEKWLMGLFMNFNEDGPSYFLYVQIDEKPKMPFLRYSLNNGKMPEFVDSPEGHGYTYIKIIKSSGTHGDASAS